MKKIALVFVILGLLFSCSNGNLALEKELSNTLNQIRSELDIPGINLAIVNADNSIITVSSGFSDKEKQILMKPDDKMFSGSTGKTFCAATILQLVDEGILRIEDSLSTFFGSEAWFAKVPNAGDVTIRMLLNHTTGIPRYAFDSSVWAIMKENPDKTWTGEERLSFIYNMKPLHAAGKGWGYSDTNYIILGMLIEKLTGNSYYDEIKKRFLEPCELYYTLPGNSRSLEGLITGYTSYTKEFLLPEKVLLENGKLAFNPQMEFSGGGIACSTADLAKWGKIYYGGQVFSDKSLQMMGTSSGFETTLSDHASYGFAAFIWKENNQISYGHTGLFPGYLTIVEYIPALNVSLAMQWNTDKSNPDKSLYQYLKDIKTILFN